MGKTSCPTKPVPIHRITRSAVLIVAIGFSLASVVTSLGLGVAGNGLRAAWSGAHKIATPGDELIHVDTSATVPSLRDFFIREIGSVDEEARVEGSVGCLFNILVQKVRFLHRFVDTIVSCLHELGSRVC